jgi:hypothetical protein
VAGDLAAPRLDNGDRDGLAAGEGAVLGIDPDRWPYLLNAWIAYKALKGVMDDLFDVLTLA